MCCEKYFTQHKSTFLLDNHAILASASSTGHITLWDLNHQGRLLHIIRGAHDGAVTALEWIPGQPVLVSSGDDNSVKVQHFPFLALFTNPEIRLYLAMAVRLANCPSAPSQIPIRTSCATALDTILWRRWKAASYCISRSESTMHIRRS